MIHALMAVAAAAQTAVAPAPSGAEFGAWGVECDNTRTCVAVAGIDGAEPAWLRVARDGAATASAQVSFGMELARPAEAADGLRIRVLGPSGVLWSREVPALGTDRWGVSSHRAQIAASDVPALLAALADGVEVRLSVIGQTDERALSLKGSSATLRWIDDRQRRVGSETAIVARGPAPVASVPPPPPAPEVRRARAVAQDRLPSKRLAFMIKAIDEGSCDPDPENSTTTVARLAPGVLLWLTRCYYASYNDGVFLFMTDEQGRRREDLETTAAREVGMNENLRFDPATMTLRSESYLRGTQDCGVRYAWVWDGQAFRTTEDAHYGVCAGLPQRDWFVSYQARVLP